MLPTTRRGLSGLSALLGIRPASTVASATSTSSPSTPPATTVTAHESGIEPAWDASTDPLTVVRELQWMQDTLRYLLVVRLRDRSGSDPLAGGPLTHAEASEFSQCAGEGLPRECARGVSDREQRDDQIGWTRVAWERLTDPQWPYERPIFEAPPEVRARIHLPDED